MRLRSRDSFIPVSRRAGPLAAAVFIVFAIIYMVPFMIHGSLSGEGLLANHEGSAALFLFSMAIAKFGTALAFVLIFDLAHDRLAHRWLNYGAIWALMFLLSEVGQALGSDYSWVEAAAGGLSELIYFPLSAFFVARLLPPERG